MKYTTSKWYSTTKRNRNDATPEKGKDKGVDHDTDSKDDEKLISASVGDRAKDNAPAKFKANASTSKSLIKKEPFGKMHRNTGYFRDSNELPLHLPTTELKVKIIIPPAAPHHK